MADDVLSEDSVSEESNVVLMDDSSVSSDMQPIDVDVSEESNEVEVPYGVRVMEGWVAKTHRRLQSCYGCKCGCCGSICNACC